MALGLFRVLLRAFRVYRGLGLDGIFGGLLGMAL